MKKIIILILMVFVLFGCSPNSDELLIKKNKNYINLKVNEKYKISNIIDAIEVNWVSSNEEVIIVEDEYVIAISNGQSIVTATFDNNNIIYIFNVNDEINAINITGKNSIKIGEVVGFSAIVHPESAPQYVIWKSSDEKVLQVDDEGNVKGISHGLARIKAISKVDTSIVSEFLVAVEKEIEKISFDEMINEVKDNIESININDYRFLDSLVKNSIGTVIGVSGFNANRQIDFGSGLIYKREVYLDDASIIQDNSFLNHLDKIDYFKYYVITNEHIFKNAAIAKIFYGEKYIDANIIAKDPKSNLALITFEAKLYFPVARLSSEELVKGQAVLAIGNPEGFDYYQSVSAGIISNLERYVSYDTDGDSISDWGMMFIQHDASISFGNYGGPLINLKGEVIAINTRKEVSWSIEGMNFAIPIDDVMSIISILETGNIPGRVALGISGNDVIDIINRPAVYPNVNIYGAKYGFYVETVNDGLAKNAGILEKDIIISYNNIELKNINELRSEINRYLLGSGERVPVKILRNGQLIELVIVY